MNSKTKRLASVIAIFLVVCTSQILVTAGFVAPEDTSVNDQSQGQVAAGILTTVGNKPITVNGAASITGTTILSGASLETPHEVEATVSLPTLGSLEMEQDAKVTLTYQSDQVHVLLLKGCVTLRANKGVTGIIETSKDVISKTDPKEDGVLRVCHPDSVLLAAAPAAVGGLGKLATLAVIGVPAAVAIPVITSGSNPSNSNP